MDTFYVGFFGGFIFLQLVNFCAQLEYDNERSGDFSPLKYLPPNKVAVLGIVTTKSPKASYLAEFITTDRPIVDDQLEDAQELKARIHEAAEVVAAGVPPRSKEAALNQLVVPLGFSSVCTDPLPRLGFALG